MSTRMSSLAAILLGASLLGAGPGGDAGLPVIRPLSEVEELEVATTAWSADEERCVVDIDAEACFRAARGWHQGIRVDKPDLEQAINLYEAACSFKHAEACVSAGWMYVKMQAGLRLVGPDGRVSLDMGSAERHFRAACEFGRLDACGLWGELLLRPGSLVANPEIHIRDLEPDPILARQAFGDGCNEGNLEATLELPDEPLQADLRSCARLAEVFQAGYGIRKDPERQLYYLRRACAVTGGERFCPRADELAAKMAAEQAAAEQEKQPKRGRKKRKK